MGIDEAPLVARIPADVDRPDKILYGMNARQLVVLAATAAAASWAYLMTAQRLPLPAVVAVVLPIIAAGAVLAVGHRDGHSLDRFVIHAARHAHGRKNLVHAPEGVTPPPAWCRVRGRLPGPLHLPVRSVRDDGVLELADGGTAVLVRAGTVAFGLRTSAEQAGLVAAFGRWLNSLEAPAQILMQTRPVDLSDLADQIARKAPDLDPIMEEAALDHAAFLASLGADYDLLARQILIVLRDQPTDRQPSSGAPAAHRTRRARHTRRTAAREVGAAVVIRRAEETVRALGVLGISAHLLDGTQALAVLADSLSPGEDRLPGLSFPGEAITAPSISLETAR